MIAIWMKRDVADEDPDWQNYIQDPIQDIIVLSYWEPLTNSCFQLSIALWSVDH